MAFQRILQINKEDRQKAVNELKNICQEIGCSGLEPDMCQNHPHKCNIIRTICKGVEP